MKVAEIKERQRLLVTPEMIDRARNIDPKTVRASTVEEIRILMHQPRTTKRKVHFIDSDEIFPIPMYVTRPREHQIIKSAHITASGDTLTAYSGERDRSFRPIVTAAHELALRG